MSGLSLSDLMAKKAVVDAESKPKPPVTSVSVAPKATMPLIDSTVAKTVAPVAPDALTGDTNAIDAAVEANPIASVASVDRFSDEIEVQKPERDLPEELTEQQQAFINLLDSVYELHHDADAVQNAVSRIMTDMKETEHLANLVEDDDVTNIVRKMKQILGFRKATKKAKAKGRPKTAAVAELESMFDDLMGGL